MPRTDIEAMEPAVRAQIEAAFAALDRALAERPSDAQRLLEANGTLGQILLAYDLPSAEPALANAAELAPEDPRWHYYLGRLFRLAGRTAEAEAAYLRAAELAPDDPVMPLRLAQVRLDAGDLTGAAEAAEAAVRLSPDLAFGHYLLGQIAAEDGRAEAA
ncbi:MAG: tetratricopeptide repeat protein, partial [Chloroflexi bacterium]|nr:tetratricopeptide repeat protein [Chloroflexota bacterium]